MGLMDFIKKQFIDVIQWTEEDDGTLAWRFPMAGMEIQNGGTRVVRDDHVFDEDPIRAWWTRRAWPGTGTASS